MSESEYLSQNPELQADRLPMMSAPQVPPGYVPPKVVIGAAMQAAVIDPLRRDFISECLNHVQRLAFMADRAISVGQDPLYEQQIEMMRSVMREAMKTYKEMKECE